MPLPIFGNFLPIILKGIVYADLDLVAKYGNTYGAFYGSTPAVCSADIDLIKAGMVKDFSNFVNRKVNKNNIITSSLKSLSN